MSSEELRFINAFIGFCTPSGETWPAPFVRAGYTVTGLEHEVETIVDGRVQSPVPEMICSSSQEQHCVLIEAKSGSINDRQARGYRSVTANQLVVQGLAADEIRPSDACVDVIYMANANNAARLSEDFGRAGFEFPIVVHGESCFRLEEGQIVNGYMNETFARGIPVDESSWPMGFVRCDRGSSDGDLAAVCIRKMIALLIRYGEVEIEQLASSSIDLWDRRGREDKQVFRRRLTELLAEASQTEFKGEIERDKGARRWRRTKYKALTNQSLDRLSDLAAQFVQRKQEGRPFKEGQPPLFDYGLEG